MNIISIRKNPDYVPIAIKYFMEEKNEHYYKK